MLPGNVDPRRPDKVQRYVPKTNNTNNGQEDLTTDYMNILGQHPTTANASEASDKHADSSSVSTEANTNQVHGVLEEVHPVVTDDISISTNMIPTSSQYGDVIIPNPVQQQQQQDVLDNNSTPTTETDAIMKPSDDTKDLNSTPSRNVRFKVVKIASLEPFKRGRWKCMDYVDDAPPVTSQSKIGQSQGSIQVAPGGVYLQTQSLPQQQIQQMLLQSGFTNGTPFFSQVPAAIVPSGQYFYPQMNTLQNQTLPSQQQQQQQQVPTSMPIQFNAGQQAYFPAGVIQNAGFTTVPSGYTNVQYVPANLVQNQNSAFVPTSQQTVQLPANFQQSQTYAGQPTVSQSNVPLVNGHAYPQQQQQQQNEQNTTPASLPSQTAKSVILNNNPQPVVSQNQINQQQQSSTVPNQMVTVTGNNQTQAPVQNQPPPQQQQQVYQQNTFQQQQIVNNQQPSNPNTNNPVHVSPNLASVVQAPTIIQVSQVMPSQNFDQNLGNNVYTNPQFTMSVNSLTVLDNNDASTEQINESGGVGGGGGGVGGGAGSGTETASESTDDVAKTNPVVNAIDNKIEQAMDLVKSHLMYTVREEVEVLKEKITELLDRIQQLENENNFLRQQIPKNQNITVPTVTSTSNTTSQNSLPITNSSTNLNAQTTSAPPTTPSPNPVTNTVVKALNEANTQQ